MSKQIIKYDSSLQQNKDYYIEERFITKGEYFSPHWHDYFEIDFVIGISKKKEDLSDYLKEFVTIAL